MPNFEFEFNQQDRELTVTQEDANLNSRGDYIRLTIYPLSNDTIVTLPRNNQQAIFYSSLNEEEFDINISPFGAKLNELRLKTIGGLRKNDFKIYQTHAASFFIKPNEIFNDFELPQGNYRIQVDFLNQLAPFVSVPVPGDNNAFYQFIVKQISTSRKEVRLKLLDRSIENNSEEIIHITNELNNNEPEFIDEEVGSPTPNPNFKYQFKHILNIGTGDHVPIMNYAFDKVTDGRDNQSLILKLYEPLSTTVTDLSMVTIEREVITTQVQEIFYFSDVSGVVDGEGLDPQPQENWINPDGNDIEFENYNDLSSSLDDITLDNLISSSYDYPNLNTDFTKFENHTFFGSAKKKLENFNTKVETIQGHYSEISQSLSDDGVAIAGDSAFLIQKRKDLFKKINKEINSFTPYERFLYFDGQSESTSSAPGLGRNYADTIPVAQKGGSQFQESKTLPGFDGFSVVYKHSNGNLKDGSTGGINTGNNNLHVDLFTDKYLVHDKPFFNYSSSIYLSFLLKGTDDIPISSPIKNTNSRKINLGGGQKIDLPFKSFYVNDILKPATSQSQYRRFVYQVSSSYFIPNTADNDMAEVRDFTNTSTEITILNTNVKTGSSAIKDSTGKYPSTVITQSGVPFKGSIMPAGELFRINYTSGSGAGAEATQSFITDVRVSFNNPSNAQPFSELYHTSSNDWTTWYNGMLTKAENFDTDNIHSFENNLPVYIQESSEYNDMKDFLSLQGEQYDLIRNHIDSMGTIHKRGYKKTDSPPNNTLPMLLSNMGWQAINPFSSSLADYYGGQLSSGTSVENITENTWRKTLNNLVYIYKSKGTKNSIRALLNTYGYPADVLEFQEFGGSTEESNPRIFVNTPPSDSGVDLSLNKQTGSFSFTSKKEKLNRYIFNGDSSRILNLDWWMDSANINSFQFIYKHKKTSQAQTIIKSSGSASQTLWDLRLVPSSDGLSSSFAFRLNNSLTGSLAIASNAVSMSTGFNSILDGQLWNVMVQRISSSISGSGTNEYRLHTALQEDSSIKTYNYVTMSVSGGLSVDSNHRANNNWQSSGSRHPLSSSNLFVGETFSGSLSEIRGWATSLSTSKFRQHTLNKFSTVGNTINSHKDDLVYHFKLNENYSSASFSASAQNLTIIDSAPTTTYSDYSFTKPANLFTGSLVYGFDFINTNKLSLQDNVSKRNDNTILINPKQSIVGNLNPQKPAIQSLTNVVNKKPKFKASNRLELYRSPQTFVDNFILDNLSGFNLETLYGNPINYYSQSYSEFDTFRENFFDAHPIEVNVNEFIRAHEGVFNHSIIEGIKSLVPARSTFSDRNSNIGVEIKPTILEKQKYENEEHGVEVNPNTATGSIKFIENNEYKQTSLTSTFESLKTGSISINITNTATLESTKSGSHNIDVKLSDSLGGKEILSIYNSVKEGNVNVLTQKNAIKGVSGSGKVSRYDDFEAVSFTGTFEQPHSQSISLGNNYQTSSMGGDSNFRDNEYITPPFLQPDGYSASIVNPHSASFTYSETTGIKNIPPTLTDSTVPTSKNGTIDYASDANKSFVNVHKNWGTSSADVHHINFAAPTGSYGTFNTYDIETRFIFHAIGDTEYYSGSIKNESKFSDSTRFYNRLYLTEGVHGNVNYDSKNFGKGDGVITGRMMGKTRYFATSSDGNIILPSNHVSKYVDHYLNNLKDGAQNVNPGILNVQHEDYSTASFYRVKVTGGDNEIYVRSGQPSTDGSSKIIYD